MREGEHGHDGEGEGVGGERGVAKGNCKTLVKCYKIQTMHMYIHTWAIVFVCNKIILP